MIENTSDKGHIPAASTESHQRSRQLIDCTSIQLLSRHEGRSEAHLSMVCQISRLKTVNEWHPAQVSKDLHTAQVCCLIWLPNNLLAPLPHKQT